jgi:hypothetical protein
MRRGLCAAVVSAFLVMPCLNAVADDVAQPEEGALAVYLRAERLIKISAPAATSMESPNFPPYPEEWMRAAQDAWIANAEGRALSHQARSIEEAKWPEGNNFTYLNPLRNLANDLGDACLYESVRHHPANAVEIARDEMHLAELLQKSPGKSIVHTLVGAGIDSLVANRLMVITSNVALSKDDGNTAELRVRTARELIKELLDQRDAKEQVNELVGPDGSDKDPAVDVKRILENLNRSHGERIFAAMSLACHLYEFEKGSWPEKLGQLTPDYLPRVPFDPWGDGKQTYEYVLIKGGLPDGSDRPLVYSRCRSKDGLFYRIDEAQFGFYQGDGSALPAKDQKQGGQFRDVTLWQPQPLAAGTPTTKTLP